MQAVYQMYIDGKWVDSSSGESFPSENPFNGEEWALIPRATEQDIEESILAARSVFENELRCFNGAQRAHLMYKLADLIDRNAEPLSRIETTDNGPRRKRELEFYFQR